MLSWFCVTTLCCCRKAAGKLLIIQWQILTKIGMKKYDLWASLRVSQNILQIKIGKENLLHWKGTSKFLNLLLHWELLREGPNCRLSLFDYPKVIEGSHKTSRCIFWHKSSAEGGNTCFIKNRKNLLKWMDLKSHNSVTVYRLSSFTYFLLLHHCPILVFCLLP